MAAGGSGSPLGKGWPWIGLVLLGLLLYPQFVSRYYIVLSTEVVILALLATSYNLIFGYAGLVSFGHAAFFGLGAYGMALLTKHYGFPMLGGLLAAPLVAAVFALLIGWFSMRTIRLYFSLLSLAFAQLLWVIVFQWTSFTGGSDGIHGVPRPEILNTYASYYYFALGVTLVCMVLMWFIVNSPFGWSLRAIRENTQRSQFLGINDRFYKVIAFTIAGAFAGVAGGLYSQFQKWADPELLFWTTSANPVLMSILGGMFSFVGPSVGAVVFVSLREIIKVRTEYWPLVLGVVLLTLVLSVPDGIVGFLVGKVRLLLAGKRAESSAE
jgi:branched-chain amino acid transport system permease protein